MKIKIISLAFIVIFACSVFASEISDILAPIQGQYEIIWAYNASDTSDPWKKYVPRAPDWANDLQEMVPGQGYWIKMLNNSNITVSGTVPDSKEINLVTGWNLLGYPSTGSQEISTALSSIDGKYEIVWYYNSSDHDDPWRRYMPDSPGNDLEEMSPGCGYWIKMTEDATITL